MPAIASLEDLKIAQRDFRSMFLAVTPYALRLQDRIVLTYIFDSGKHDRWIETDTG